MNQRPPIALLILFALATLSPVAAAAQDEDKAAYIQIEGGSSSQVPLALAWPRLEGADAQAAGDALMNVLRSDLELSGYFSFLDPAAFIEQPGSAIAPGEFDFEHWRLPGAVGLVKTGVETRPTDEGHYDLAVTLYVYDVDAGVPMLSRVLRGPDSHARTLAHRVSNAVIEAFTGEPGVFDTRIVAIANFGRGKEVYTFDFDGQNPRAISKNGSINLAPAWSPDGGRISYTSYRDNNPDLWVTDLTSGRHSKVSAHPGINAGAEWAPDGRALALTLSKDGDSEIYLIEPSGSIIRRMTRQWGIDVSPTFSPDGGQIAFVSNREGTPQIFVMDRESGETRRLTYLGGHNVSPSWSPDGQQIAFSSRDEGRFDVFVINADGSGLRRLTQSVGDDEDPSWSPDGNHILFSSSRDGRARQLYIMSAEGSNQRRITDGRGSYSNPQWGPRPTPR